MSAILKTLPIRFARGQLERFLGAGCNPCFTRYYFTLGRGRPKQSNPTQLYFTHSGRIIGYFDIEEIVQNVGQLPKLTTLDGDPSQWQIKGDAWVAVCRPPFCRLSERVYHEGFRLTNDSDRERAKRIMALYMRDRWALDEESLEIEFTLVRAEALKEAAQFLDRCNCHYCQDRAELLRKHFRIGKETT
jgi:hypothetical protein